MCHRQQLRCDRFALLAKLPETEQPEQVELKLVVDGGSAAAPQWRTAAQDLPTRRRVVQRVLALLQPQQGRGASASDSALLAKRVELALYSRAGSLNEYAAAATLRRRVQALVAASVHEAHALAAVSATGKRQSQEEQGRPSPKRQRCVIAAGRDRARGIFPLLANEDVTRAVFAFLDGKQVLQLRVLNSFSNSLLPSCVFSIRLEVSQLLRSLDASSSSLSSDVVTPPLAALTNLRQLVVHTAKTAVIAPAVAEDSPASIHAPLHAWSCSELAPTATNDGEEAVCRLAPTLCRFPKLASLQLAAAFCNTSARNAAKQLSDALAAGACPRLNDLVLGGNHLADAGARELARAIASGNLSRLTRLDLRRNYVSDRGVAAVLSALSRNSETNATNFASRLVSLALGDAPDATPSLRALCLGGNLLTDASVDAVVELIRRSRLAFLGLEDNFLSKEGVDSVVQGARSGQEA